MTQSKQILRVLRENGQITNFDAIHGTHGFICLRLGARIHDLRQLGHTIETKKLPNKNTAYILEEALTLFPN